jgi:hypothetical protein
MNVYGHGLNSDVIRDIVSYISIPFHFKTLRVNTYKIRQHINLMDFCVDPHEKEELEDINRQLSLMNFRDLDNSNHETINYDLSFLKNLIISEVNPSIKYLIESKFNVVNRRIDFQRENYMVVFTRFTH